MHYMRLGASGLIVSRLSLGTLSFGKGLAQPDFLYKVDDATAARLVAQALDAGITYFNTANVYADGHSEAMLARALGDRRRDIVLCTKVGLPCGPALTDRGLSRGHILSAVDASLKRLDTDWIDMLVLHCADPRTPMEETLEALDRIVASGKARYVGLSNWPAWQVAKAAAIQQARGLAPFRVAEMYYSLLGRDVEHELVPAAHDAGIGLQAWSPLAGGLLSGRHRPDDLRDGTQPLSNYGFLPIDRDRAITLLDAMEDIARDTGASIAQIAIAWLLARPAVASVIIGASSSAQLTDNLGAADLILAPDTLARLDALSAPDPIYPGWYAKTFADPMLDGLA